MDRRIQKKVETIVKHLLNKLCNDEASFSDARSLLNEASKQLISEKREDPSTTSDFLVPITKLHAPLMQSLVSVVSIDVTGAQGQISNQENSGLSTSLLQEITTNYYTTW